MTEKKSFLNNILRLIFFFGKSPAQKKVILRGGGEILKMKN